MTADAEPGRQTPVKNILLAAWLLLGLATYWYASLAIFGAINARRLFPLFMGLLMGNPTLAVTLAVALTPLAPTLGYIAIRYWVLPSRPQGWRNAVALPLVVLPCMIVASAVAGLAASLVFIALQSFPAVLNLPLLALVTGALAGTFLYGIERLATQLLFGWEEAAGLRAALCGAHVAGFAAVLLAGSLPGTIAIHVFHVAISQTWAGWLLLPILACGELAHLLMAWRAWGSGSRPVASAVRDVAGGLVLAFVAMSLIGAAARAPWSVGPLQALTWPLSYFTSWPKT